MIRLAFKKIALLLALFTIGGTSVGASSEWPPLPTKGFITGRPAQKQDVAKGDAVFVAAIKDTVIGKPLSIPIPQYARLIQAGTPVVIVQAEEANGIELFGGRGLDGQEAVVTEKDLELLGTKTPE